jgi:hypothetical protein
MPQILSGVKANYAEVLSGEMAYGVGVGIWCDRARDDLIACASERTTQHDRLEFQTLSYSKFYDQGQSPGLRVCYHMYLRVPCDVFKYAFMCTGTPASYAVCQTSQY